MPASNDVELFIDEIFHSSDGVIRGTLKAYKVTNGEGMLLKIRRYGPTVESIQSSDTDWQHEDRSLPREIEINLDERLHITDVKTYFS